MNFDQAFDRLLLHEGDYSFHAADPGGETMYGITAAVAKDRGYTGMMMDLTIDQAKAIYRSAYWTPLFADQLPPEVRFDVFDGAVNSGVGQSARWLQRALCVTVDGVIGPATLAACQFVPGAILRLQYNGQRLVFLSNLATWPTFGRGWARRISKNLLFP